jgi:gluconolactonase
MNIRLESFDKRFFSIIHDRSILETVAAGFRFVEGPVWHPYERYLLFSDIMGNGLYRWSRLRGLTLFRENSYLTNGNTLDRKGRLLSCEHGTSRVSRTNLDGSYEVLISAYNGKGLNSPNDIVVKSDGAVYFTDPNPGRKGRVGIPRDQELDFQGVYRFEPDSDSGTLALLADDFSLPNGLCFSLDEKYLYVNDSDRSHIRVFDVKEDGTVGNGRIWAELKAKNGKVSAGTASDTASTASLAASFPGVADGMKIDSAGNLFCSGPGGIWVFSSEEDLLGIIYTPEVAANFTWGDDDLCSLYITATTSVYRLRVSVPGKAIF